MPTLLVQREASTNCRMSLRSQNRISFLKGGLTTNMPFNRCETVKLLDKVDPLLKPLWSAEMANL